MRKLYLLSLLFLFTLFISCHDKTSESKTISQTDTLKKDSINSDQIKAIDLASFSDLVPVEVKDSLNKNVFEKFGIEFNGNCYACDLAKINISKNEFNFINICNDSIIYRIENFTYATKDNIFIFKMTKNEFHFTKIDEAPVYKLDVKGEKLNLKDLRIPIYFTPKKNLSKFKEHDCGDFQG